MSTPDTPTFDPEKITRLFSHPMQLPASFKTWMLDQLVLGVPDLPLGQVFQGHNLAKQLGHAATAITATSQAETTVFSVTLKGGQLAKNGRITLDTFYDIACADASNQGHMKLYLGGNLLATVDFNTAFLDGTIWPGTVHWVIRNRDSYSSQRVDGFSWLGVTGFVAGSPAAGAIGTGAVDTSVDQTLALKVSWRDGGGQVYTSRLTTCHLFNPVQP